MNVCGECGMHKNDNAGGHVWMCRDRCISLEQPQIMGIVNVTPDSFSDGGQWFDTDRAVNHALELVAEGADIVDIGGESTRPGSDAVSPDEEERRVVPVVRALASRSRVPISIDTRRPSVAQAAIGAGACIVNDVMPFAGDAAMADVVRETGAGLVAMHMRGTPQNMTRLTDYADVVEEVEAALRAALAYAEEQGISAARVVIDPGIGFAKTTSQSVVVLSATARLARLAPVLIGASRKRFIGELCDEPSAEKRLGGSIGVAVWSVLRGASVVRVHDVRATRQALTVIRALSNGEGC